MEQLHTNTPSAWIRGVKAADHNCIGVGNELGQASLLVENVSCLPSVILTHSTSITRKYP